MSSAQLIGFALTLMNKLRGFRTFAFMLGFIIVCFAIPNITIHGASSAKLEHCVQMDGACDDFLALREVFERAVRDKYGDDDTPLYKDPIP